MKHPPEKQDLIERILQDIGISLGCSLMLYYFFEMMGW